MLQLEKDVKALNEKNKGLLEQMAQKSTKSNNPPAKKKQPTKPKQSKEA